YNTANNRINSTGWEYDLAGNQIRGQNDNGVWLRFEYDEAGRLVKVKDDAGNDLEVYTYGRDRARLIKETTGGRVYYAFRGTKTLAEYTEISTGTSLIFIKSYLYTENRLLSPSTSSGGAEFTEFHHS